MQTATVVCVGNLKEGYWKDAAAEYQKRLGAFCKLLVVESKRKGCRRSRLWHRSPPE